MRNAQSTKILVEPSKGIVFLTSWSEKENPIRRDIQNAHETLSLPSRHRIEFTVRKISRTYKQRKRYFSSNQFTKQFPRTYKKRTRYCQTFQSTVLRSRCDYCGHTHGTPTSSLTAQSSALSSRHDVCVLSSWCDDCLTETQHLRLCGWSLRRLTKPIPSDSDNDKDHSSNQPAPSSSWS